jgi:hypothetical protein
VREGAVVFRDALDDNHGGWLLVDKLVLFRHGVYEWRGVPPARAASFADAALKRPIPSGVSISVSVTMREGAALRGVACRELGAPDEPLPQDWYELGIDGRRALVRRMRPQSAPKVLKTAAAPVADGRPVRLTGQCVPDGDGGLVLALRLDGREVVRARDAHPLPARRGGVAGTPAIFAYARPDTDRPPTLDWDNFELRSATLADAPGD